MGKMARNSREARFIREFNKDFVARYGLPDVMLSLDYEDGDPCQGLALDEAFSVIRLYAEIREDGADGDSVGVVIERAGFIGLDDERDMIDFLVDKLDIDEGTVRTRLIKAKLLREDT